MSPCSSPDHGPHIGQEVSLITFRQILPKTLLLAHIFKGIIMTWKRLFKLNPVMQFKAMPNRIKNHWLYWVFCIEFALVFGNFSTIFTQNYAPIAHHSLPGVGCPLFSWSLEGNSDGDRLLFRAECSIALVCLFIDVK